MKLINQRAQAATLGTAPISRGATIGALLVLFGEFGAFCQARTAGIGKVRSQLRPSLQRMGVGTIGVLGGSLFGELVLLDLLEAAIAGGGGWK
jgi:hypothetical protein